MAQLVPVYPNDFLPAAKLLLSTIQANDTPTAEVVHAAWIVLGFGLGQFLPCECDEHVGLPALKGTQCVTDGCVDLVSTLRYACDKVEECDNEDCCKDKRVKLSLVPWEALARFVLKWLLEQLVAGL